MYEIKHIDSYMNGNLTHWQPISNLVIGILSSKWPIKLLWIYSCKYHNPGDCWPFCDEQWSWFFWRTQFEVSGVWDRGIRKKKWGVRRWGLVSSSPCAIGSLSLLLKRYFWQRDNRLRVFLLNFDPMYSKLLGWVQWKSEQ